MDYLLNSSLLIVTPSSPGLTFQAQQGGLGRIPLWIWIAVIVLVIIFGVIWTFYEESESAKKKEAQPAPAPVAEARAVEAEPAPAVEAEPAPAPAEPPPAPPKPDKLTQIKGIGPKIEKLLNDNGITTLAQLAEADPNDLEALLDAQDWYMADADTWPAQAREIIEAESKEKDS